MSPNPCVTDDDVTRLTEKLSQWAASSLSLQEQTLLAGVLELAGKMYEGTTSADGKRKLPLTRETVRDLNLWERLIETQGHSLWTCDRPPVFGEDVINPQA
ncbi:hypothetical protein [Caldimonas brevitalea]|uniref:Uncharacterized protein n=1 Tax=Caldimonas brevitalea TaxID=413882 RepID=A0A0G3BJL6_9BURK|nr:hypothetical protein [Caldimonas brevitalea]AKJ29649.1 hypothetical protein AAW51_2958 [Caldimonas brevitalea]